MGAAESPVVLQRHRVTVDEYYRMAEAGILAPDARVELIEGEVIDMAPMNSPHAGTVRLLTRTLERAVGDRAVVSCQCPLPLSRYSEPEPDLALLVPRADFYTSSHPSIRDVLLVIEVSDTTIDYDRRIKLPLYARAGIPEAWIVDLNARVLRFFRRPSGDGYLDITTTETPGATPIGALPGLTLELADLFSHLPQEPQGPGPQGPAG